MGLSSEKYQKQKEYRLSNNLCVNCGKKNDRLPKQLCRRCTEFKRKQQKRYRDKLKSKELCLICRKPLDRIGAYCSNCVERINESSAITNARYLYKGLCVCCKKPLDREGSYCIKCCSKFKKYGKEYRKNKREGD